MLKRQTIEKTLGKTVADNLDEIIINAGEMVYSKRQMVEQLDCGNFMAARRLSKVLRRLSITTPAHLFNIDPGSLLRAKTVGEMTVFVAMCILDAHRFSVSDWWGWDNDRGLHFGALKARAVRRSRKRKHDVTDSVVSNNVVHIRRKRA